MCHGTLLRKQIAHSASQLKNFALRNSIKIVRVAGEKKWKLTMESKEKGGGEVNTMNKGCGKQMLSRGKYKYG